MGIHEEITNIAISVDNEKVAKGVALSWVAIAAADGNIGKKELLIINKFATVNPTTKKFYSEQWLSAIFEEAIKIIKEGGLDALFSEIPSYFSETKEGDSYSLLYSLMLLSIFEEDFSSKEMDAVYRIVDLLDIPRKYVLHVAMTFAGRSLQSFVNS